MKNKKPRTFDSLRQAAAALKLPMRVLKAAKAEGCEAFKSNRIHEAELLAFLEANPEIVGAAGEDPREEKLREEIRKLRIANDAKEGRLVERAWVAERMQAAAGALNRERSRWEAEHPVKFAAAAGDIPECRMILRGIFDDVFRNLQDLGRHFEDDAT